MRLLLCVTLWSLITSSVLIAEDLDLRDLDVKGWPCLNELEGTAKTADGTERNRMKNRSPTDLSGQTIESLDTPAFLKKVHDYDAQLKATRRNELTAGEKQKLQSFENQMVSLTGWCVLSYPGPPETTNCGDKNFHDWHLEIFEKSSEHHPQIGDPTPIICEVTPRTEQVLFRDGVRLRQLAGFFRSKKEFISTHHPAQVIKVTGYVMWDDDHNGKADVGTKIEYVTEGNGFHHPWRSTAWEIHPILKIERVDAAQRTPLVTVSPRVEPSIAPTSPASATLTPVEQQFITLTQPIRIQLPYGQTVLNSGTKLPIVQRDSTTVWVRYMDQTYPIQIMSTDLK
jgi:hypothetical protein